jgi:hypothetical protein
LATIMKNLNLGRIDFHELRINWKGYIYFLKKNKIFAYLKYAETKLSETQAIIQAKREKRYKRPNNPLPEKLDQETLPLSCNSTADIQVVIKSDYLQQ